MYRVFVLEYERGRGFHVEEIHEFETKKEALEFEDEYNEKYYKHDSNWFMMARLEWEV